MAEKEQRFTTDIEKIVDTGNIPLTITVDTREVIIKVNILIFRLVIFFICMILRWH